MSAQPPAHDVGLQALEELRMLGGQLRDNRGKPQKGLTSSVKEHWSHLVTAVFTDPDCPTETLLDELSSFPPGVVAGGIAVAWERMDEARRGLYLSWLGSLDSERAASHKIVLIPFLLERFPTVSLELLCGLSLNQQLKNRLAAAILASTPEKVRLMIAPDLPEWKVRQVLERLCQISEIPKADMKARWEVVRLTFITIVDRKLDRDTLSQRLIQHVETQLPNLAPQFQQQLQELLRDSAPGLLRRLFPSAAGAVTAVEEQEAPAAHEGAGATIVSEKAQIASPGAATEASPESCVRSNVLDRLAGWLDTLHGRAALLTDTRARILELEQENRSVRAQLDTARAAEEANRSSAEDAISARQLTEHRLQMVDEKYQKSQNLLDASLRSLRDLETELHAARECESQSRRELQQRATDFGKEREDLQRLIQANADRRLQEFQNSIGGSLRKLLSRVPERGTPVPPELGAVLLARLYEVMDELESKGIRARPEREAASQ